MSFSSFVRSVIAVGSAIESAGDLLDEASCKSQAGSISSELISFCEKYSFHVDIEGAISSRIDILKEILEMDDSEIEEMGGNRVMAVGAAFMELAFYGFILDRKYHNKLTMNLFKVCKKDEYGDLPKKKIIKVIKGFLDDRIENLIDYSRSIVSDKNFSALSHPVYTYGFMSEDAKASDWAEVIYEGLNESGLFDDDKYISEMAEIGSRIDDHVDELEENDHLDGEEIPNDVFDLESLVNSFVENGWQCSEPEEKEPFNVFFARSPEDLMFFVIYHDGEFDKDEFVHQFNLASALMENGDCQLVLFFTDDEELSDALEEDIEDNFLSITLDVASIMIRSALTELQG